MTEKDQHIYYAGLAIKACIANVPLLTRTEGASIEKLKLQQEGIARSAHRYATSMVSEQPSNI